MKRTSLTRRLLAGAAGLTIGVAGALAVASPAFAHHPTVDGEAFCDELTGEWVITWTVGTDATTFAAELTNVQLETGPAGSELPELSIIKIGAEIPFDADNPVKLTEQQRLPGDTEIQSVTLTVDALFTNGDQDARYATVEIEGTCEQRDLDLATDVFVSCDFLLFFVSNEGEEDGVSMALTPNQDATQGHAPWFLELEPDDEGNVEIPEDAELEGAETLGAGETFTAGPLPPDVAHAHGFAGAEGLEVTVEILVGDVPVGSDVISWDEAFAEVAEELGCEEDDGEGGEEPKLPVTGSPSLMVAGGALVLLVLGGVIYLLARRRRVTFTV